MMNAQTIETVTRCAEIKDVVEDYLTLDEQGQNYIGMCPFHDDRLPQLYVSPTKNYCHCFVCGGGGNPISFIMKMEDVGYEEAVRILARKYHIPLEEEETAATETPASSPTASMEALRHTSHWLHQHFIKNLNYEAEGQQVGLTYFTQKRGFSQKTIQKFQLGYALKDRQWYTRVAQTEGVKVDDLVKIGATIAHEGGRTFDRFASRAMFPIHNISGQVIAFGGRTLMADDPVKYQNSPESELYQKRFALYGLCFAKEAIRQEKKAYISEGYCDVISMAQAGIENIVAPCGTALTTEQIRLLRRVIPSINGGEKHVTMMYDGDGAGVNAALKNGRLLLEQGLYVHVVILPPEDDPDTFAQNHSPEEVKAFLTEKEEDYVMFYAKYKKKEAGVNPMAKTKAIMDTAETIATIPDKIRRNQYIKDCAYMLGGDEASLTKQVGDLREKKVMEFYNKELQAQRQAEAGNFVTIKPNTGAGAALPGGAPPPMDPYDIPPEAFLPPEFLEQEMMMAPAMPQVPTMPVPIDTPTSPFEDCERRIMHYLMKAGNKVFMMVEDDENETAKKGEAVLKKPVNVARYILLIRLEVDNIEFQNPTYQRIKHDILTHIEEPEMLTEAYFLNNSDPEICKAASEILMDPRYPTNYNEDLLSTVPHIVTDLQKKVLEAEIQMKLNEIRTSPTAELRMQAMKELALLKTVYRQVADQLGSVM